MAKLVDKNLTWFQTIYLKRFRTAKSAFKYMSDTSDQNWRIVNLATLPDKALQVFGWKDKNLIDEFYEFYENDLNQHITLNRNIDGILFDISLSEYIDKYNIGDADQTPLLTSFFNDYIKVPSTLVSLNEEALEALGFESITKKKDIKTLNQWAAEQIETQMRPIYYDQTVYAHLIIILGNLLLTTKLNDYYWRVAKTRCSFYYDDKKTNIEFYYAPYLCHEDGTNLNIVQAFREYLFCRCGNSRNIFTSIYNNIEKYNLNAFDYIDLRLPRKF